MTSNVQLEGYIKKHKHRLHNQNFLGVFPSDQLPNLSGRNECMIINYSPSSDDGTHWIAMRNLNNALKPAEYFDSYGLHPDEADSILGLTTNFTAYLKEHSSTMFIYNTIDLQSWRQGEDECGEWCLLFLMEGLPNVNNKVWSRFLAQKYKHIRDKMVKRYIHIRK